MGRLKTRDWKTRDWKTRDHLTGGGKPGTGKRGTIIQGVENARPLAMEHRTDKCIETKIQFIST